MARNGWSLEVVKGREPGRAYPLAEAATLLGNALAGAPGIDLASQEGESPRRMAGRQAVVETTATGHSLRDLDSPGGTFVNRQRILPGQSRALQPGDVIQIGGVQLRVVATNGKPPAPAPAPPTLLYRLGNGATCRSWDDFLRVAAQRWTDLRDELTSGRLDAWLQSTGRADLIAPRRPGDDPDESLDAWLGRLPATLNARPELDAHPARLSISVAPGGGTISRSVRLSNVGHRLLHVQATIEPGGTTWVTIGDGLAGQTLRVIDDFALPLTIAIPPTLPRPLLASLRIESDGGSKRVEILLEARSSRETDAVDHPEPRPRIGVTLTQRLARLSTNRRRTSFALVATALRTVAGLSGGWGEGRFNEFPRLTGVALTFACVSGLVGAGLGLRLPEKRYAVFSLVAMGLAGAGLAAVVVAAIRTLEARLLGHWAASPALVVLVWAVIGLVLGGLSLVVIPPAAAKETDR